MYRASLAYLTEKMRNRNYISIRLVQNSVWFHRIFCLILLLILSAAQISTWSLSGIDRECEQLQATCPAIFNDYSRTETTLPDTSISDSFISWDSGMQAPFTGSVSEFIPLSGGSDTCKCSSGSRSEIPAFRARLADSMQRLICFTQTIPSKAFCLTPIVLRNKGVTIRPSDHLKSLSTIVLII